MIKEVIVSEHEKCIGESDEWYTPKFIFDGLNLKFDLDVASPSHSHWTPSEKFFTKKEDGLIQEWSGLVFMNPPFGGRNGQVPWLEKFIEHGNGIAIVAARTSARWFQDLIPRCDSILFPNGKTKFIKPDGSLGKSPGTGVVIIAMGDTSNNALRNSNLGIFIDLNRC